MRFYIYISVCVCCTSVLPSPRWPTRTSLLGADKLHGTKEALKRNDVRNVKKGYYYLNTGGLKARWSSTVSKASVAHLSFRGNKLKTRKRPNCSILWNILETLRSQTEITHSNNVERSLSLSYCCNKRLLVEASFIHSYASYCPPHPLSMGEFCKILSGRKATVQINLNKLASPFISVFWQSKLTVNLVAFSPQCSPASVGIPRCGPPADVHFHTPDRFHRGIA